MSNITASLVRFFLPTITPRLARFLVCLLACAIVDDLQSRQTMVDLFPDSTPAKIKLKAKGEIPSV